MKRTEIKRDPDKIAAWLRKPRRAIARTALRRGPGRKAKRERPALDAFRAELRRRSGGYCEALFMLDGTEIVLGCASPWPHEGHHAHHLFPEDHDRGVHDPERGLFVCAKVHHWIHDVDPARAHELGLLRPEQAA
jgi:hypothetical protein